MFLRFTTRKKNGKERRYWSIVENKRCAGGKVVQRQVLYLGEINDQQEADWQKTIDIFEHGQVLPRTVALFPAERPVPTEGLLARMVAMSQQLPDVVGVANVLMAVKAAQVGGDEFFVMIEQ